LKTSSQRTAKLKVQGLKREKEGSDDKSGRRRRKLDIIAEILFFSEHPKRKTSITCNAKLNYFQLKSQINAITVQGLLQKKLNKYATTEKGHRFLELFAQLNDLMNEFKRIK